MIDNPNIKIPRATLNAKEAAAYLGISEWLLYELVKRRDLPCIRAGGRLLFRVLTLQSWLSSKENESIQMDTELSNEGYGVLRRAKA